MQGKKKKSRKIAIVLGVLDVVLLAVLAVLGYLLLRQNQKLSEIREAGHRTKKAGLLTETTEAAETSAAERDWLMESQRGEMESAGAGAAVPSSAVAETQPEETRPKEEQSLERVGAISPKELKSAADFVTAAGPDGAYSFMYPADYFYTGTYSAAQKKYFLATADEGVTVEVYEMPAPVQGNPYESANAMHGILKGEFLEDKACPYLHQSSGVADDGYSRLIIGGPLAGNTSRAAYYCIAFNDTTAYALKVSYVPVNHEGIGLDYTQTGYLVDCIYRGWSVSGSTYMLRSYEQYLADDMGDKKPGES